MWHHLNAVSLHDGGRYSYGSWASSHDMLLDEAVRSLGVFDFFTVACHIDECRIVWHERVNRCENLVETVAFEGREELE